jgi:hypothetical protein
MPNRREDPPNDQARDQGTDRGTGTAHPQHNPPGCLPCMEKKTLYALTAVRRARPYQVLAFSGTDR